jgi:hypothetical protein
MKFNPFLILVLPLWIYLVRFGIHVIKNQEISFDYYRGFSFEKKVKHLSGTPAKIFGYSTLIGGMLIVSSITATLFSESAPYLAGIFFITLCPIGIAINMTGLILAFLKADP